MNALILQNSYTGTNDQTVIFNDYTPLWDATSAPGGYDPTGLNCYDPNNTDTSTLALEIYAYADASTTNLVIPSSEANITDIGGTGYITYEIPITDYTFIDGIYRGTYSFLDTSTGLTYTKVTYFAVTNQLQCCLDNKLKEIEICENCNKGKKVQQLFEARMYLDLLNLFLECGEYTGAQQLLEYLNDFCNIETCNCN